MAVVVDQHQGFKPRVRSQRCRLPSFMHLDIFMCEPNQTDVTHSLGQVVLSTSNFPRSFSTPCLTLTKVEEEFNDSPRVELIGGHDAPRVRALMVEVAIAIASGVDYVPISSGLGGAYFLRNRNGDTIAVAKPIDEEPLALNNPKGFTGRMLGQPGLKPSVRVGETGIRELAAYLLDHGGFAGVPPTALVKFSQVAFHVNKSALVATPPPYKIASLQRYVAHDSDAGDLGPSGFSVSSVHRIGILDVRLLNIDRHSGNVLVTDYEHDKYSLGVTELVPIDHGLCLPERLDDPYFEWLHWPQSSIPFSEAELEYIFNLDPFEDSNLLRTQLPCLGESSIRVLIVCTLFLKRAASAGLCLGDIGEMMTRDCHGGAVTVSVLENVCSRAKGTVSTLQNCIDYGVRGEESEGEEEDIQVFQFDEECEEDTTTTSIKASMGKPPLPARAQSAKPAKGLTKKWTEGVDIKGKFDNHKVGNLFKSVSFAAPGRKDEIEGVSFGDLNEDEWDFFLDMFERLLPEVFEERKSISIIQRVVFA